VDLQERVETSHATIKDLTGGDRCDHASFFYYKQCYLPKWYLDTCPKNGVISFSHKRFCALGLGFELVEIRLNTVRFWANVHSGKCTRSTKNIV